MHRSYPFDTFESRALEPGAHAPRGGRLKAAAALAALGAATPLTAALTGAAAVKRGRAKARAPASPLRERSAPNAPKTILINTARMTKGLVLMRAFHAAGHRVIVADLERYRFGGHRFSRAVGAFYTLPDPALGERAYIDAIVSIVEREGVDVFVPVSSPAGAQVDAQAGAELAERCEVLHVSPEVNAILDDKERFAAVARELGLSVPETHAIRTPEELRAFAFTQGTRYLLKPSIYDPIGRQQKRLLPFEDAEAFERWLSSLTISLEQPWVLQQHIDGDEFCAHATVRDGAIIAYTCTASSPYQLNYAPVEHDAIRAWVERFIEGMEITWGQICVDFLVDHQGTPYAIECNPRLHSAIVVFAHDAARLGRAYLGEESSPLHAGRQPVYWSACEVERLKHVRSSRQAVRWTIHLLRGKDAVFSWSDPLPFFMLHHAQIPALLLGNIQSGRPWTHVDWCIGKVVELGGD